MVSYYKGLPPITLDNPLNTWSFEIIWKIKNILSPLPQCLKQVNSGWPRGKGSFPIIKSHNHLNKWLCEVTWQIKSIKPDFITIPIVTKLVRVVTYCENIALTSWSVVLQCWFTLYFNKKLFNSIKNFLD